MRYCLLGGITLSEDKSSFMDHLILKIIAPILREYFSFVWLRLGLDR